MIIIILQQVPLDSSLMCLSVLHVPSSALPAGNTVLSLVIWHVETSDRLCKSGAALSSLEVQEFFGDSRGVLSSLL